MYHSLLSENIDWVNINWGQINVSTSGQIWSAYPTKSDIAAFEKHKSTKIDNSFWAVLAIWTEKLQDYKAKSVKS